MKLHVLAVGDRMPRWVGDACADYQRRFPPHCSLQIRAVPAPRRAGRPDVSRLKDKEFQALCACAPAGALTVALEQRGEPWSTTDLAGRLGAWMERHKDVAFMIGGADGLAPAALEAARERWSLSTLTLPHAMVRIIVVEQLYRAWSILSNHPYHLGH